MLVTELLGFALGKAALDRIAFPRESISSQVPQSWILEPLLKQSRRERPACPSAAQDSPPG